MGRQRKWWSRSSSVGALKLETHNALRIDAGHDVLDGAVFARGIERLKDDNDGVLLAGPKQVLSFDQAGDVFQEGLVGFGLVFEAGRVRGIVVLEPDRLTGPNDERFMIEAMSLSHVASFPDRAWPK